MSALARGALHRIFRTPGKRQIRRPASTAWERGHHEPRLRRTERHPRQPARTRPLELRPLRRETRGADRGHARRRVLRPAPRAARRGVLRPAPRAVARYVVSSPSPAGAADTPERLQTPLRPPLLASRRTFPIAIPRSTALHMS